MLISMNNHFVHLKLSQAFNKWTALCSGGSSNITSNAIITPLQIYVYIVLHLQMTIVQVHSRSFFLCFIFVDLYKVIKSSDNEKWWTFYWNETCVIFHLKTWPAQSQIFSSLIQLSMGNVEFDFDFDFVKFFFLCKWTSHL